MQVSTMMALPGHHNVLPLLAACTRPPHLALVTPYCSRGVWHSVITNKPHFAFTALGVFVALTTCSRKQVAPAPPSSCTSCTTGRSRSVDFLFEEGLISCGRVTVWYASRPLAASELAVHHSHRAWGCSGDGSPAHLPHPPPRPQVRYVTS